MRHFRQTLVTIVGVLVLTLSIASTASAHTATSAKSAVPFHTVCQFYSETDNILVSSPHNPQTDLFSNEWAVYYDLRQDGSTLCSMQVVVRIFPPSGGSWSGTLNVYAYQNNVVSGSYGELVNGYTAYPGHLVSRGPWFGITRSQHLIESDSVAPYAYVGAYTKYFTP